LIDFSIPTIWINTGGLIAMIEINQGYQQRREEVGDLSMTSAAFHFLTSFKGEKDFIHIFFSPIQTMQITIAHQCAAFNSKYINCQKGGGNRIE
jgi:hypothetical protein